MFDPLNYCELGFAMFPVHSIADGKCTCGKDCDIKNIAKHPATKHGVKDATTDKEANKHFIKADYYNIGCATGEPSGFFTFDVDDLQALDKLEKQHGKLPKTWLSQTGSGGYHYCFRFDERCVNLKNAVKFSGDLDIRTTGGYVLLPPSKHASGKRYEWIIAPNECELATAPQWLIDLIPKHGDNPNNTTTKKEKPFVIERAKNEYEKCVLYLDKCPPAIQGENGSGVAFATICRVLELFGLLTNDEILSALDSWNFRCLPPWNENELRHKVEDARKKIESKQECEPNNDTLNEIEWATLHDDALIGIAGDFVRRLEPHTEADNAALLLTLLSAFGCSVGRNPFFFADGTKHYANIFCTLIGDSSRARKGTSLGRVKQILPSDKAKDVSGLSSGEGLIYAVKDSELETKDGKFLATPSVQDKRLWVVESEFARVLTVLNREGNTLSAIIRDAWDTGNLSSLTRGAPLHATDAHISILAHITKDELSRALNARETSNGFANRFLWALVKRSKLLPNGGGNVDLTDLRNRLSEAIAKAKTITEMNRSPECSKLWEDVYAELVSVKRGRWDNATSRGEAQTLRLSMLYALLDCSPLIEVKHLNSALALWRYCDDSARIVFGGSETEGGKLEQRIRQAVNKQPGVMRSELRTSLFKNGKTNEFDNALTWLIQRNEIVCVPVLEGRQADRYYPAVPTPTEQRQEQPKSEAKQPAHEAKEQPQPPTKDEIVNNPTNNNYSEIEIVEDEDQSLTEDEFIRELQQKIGMSSESKPTLSLGEVLDWINKHGIEFEQGVYAEIENIQPKVFYRKYLTKEIESALWNYRKELSGLVKQ